MFGHIPDRSIKLIHNNAKFGQEKNDSIKIILILVLWKYWALMKSRILLKLVLGHEHGCTFH